MERKKGFSRNFLLVLIGQIISLFGNAVIRFALPLHLLNETNSASLLGIVSGFAFIPLVLMSPIGGLIADRVNKRNIMVILDFFTAGLVFAFLMLYGKINLIILILILLFLLYGITGAYQPSVQASVPLLVESQKIMSANAMINMISSLSGLLGPALGGIIYQAWGIIPILYVCMSCFAFSAIMELFIKIPFEKKARTESIFHIIKSDLKESIYFITREKKEIGKLTICCASINLVMSALLIIGLPVIVMQRLEFPEDIASQMYGFLQAILAIGGLLGGLGAGIFGAKMNIQMNWKILSVASISLIPIGSAFLFGKQVYITYFVIAFFGFIIMTLFTIYTIQIISYIQIITPPELVGKVIAWIIGLSSCSQPIGQFIYGFLFENLKGTEWKIFFSASIICIIISGYSKKISGKLQTNLILEKVE